MKHFKNLELTAGAILAGLAGSSVASANHSATAHASTTVVSKDNTNAEDKSQATNKDESKTLSFSTASAEANAKNENVGSTSSLKTTDSSSDANTSSIEKQENSSNATENKSVKSDDQNTQSLKVQKSAFSVSALADNKVQDTQTAKASEAKNVKMDFYNAASNVQSMTPIQNGEISRIISKVPTELGIKGSFALDKNDIKTGNKIHVGTVTTNNNFYSGSLKDDVTNPHFDTINDGFNGSTFDAISEKYGKLGTITISKTSDNTLDLYLTITTNKQFAEDVNVSFANPRCVTVGWETPLSVYKGTTKSNPFVETVSSPSSSIKIKFTADANITPQPAYDTHPCVIAESGTKHVYSETTFPFLDPSSSKKQMQDLIDTSGQSSNVKLSNYHRIFQVSGDTLNQTSPSLAIRHELYVVDANGKLSNELLVLDGQDSRPDKEPQKVNLPDGLSLEQVYNQTPKNSVGISKQKNGSFLVCVNLTPDFYTYSDQKIANNVAKLSYLANIQDPDNKQKIIDNTVKFYSGALKHTPSGLQIGLFFDKTATNPVDVIATDVTPTDNFHNSSTGVWGNPIATSDGTLLTQITYEFVDDDNNGLVVGTPITLTGKAGDKVTPDLKVPDGYILAPNQQMPGEYTLKDSNAPVLIHLKHPAKSASLTVKYVDQDTGKEIPNTEFKQDGHEGDAITYSTADTIKKLQSEGYTVVSDEFTGKAGSKLTADNNGKTYVVTVKKQAPEVKDGKQTINFIEKKTGNTLTTVTVEGKVGSDVTTTLKVPKGYHLIEGQTVPSSVNIKDKNDPINIYVAKDEPVTPVEKDGTQTYNFVDKITGKVLTTDKVNGKVGKDVSVSLKVPEGYHLVEGETLPTSVSIKDSDNPVNIYVEKDEAKPSTPETKDGKQTIHIIDKKTGNYLTTVVKGGKIGEDVPVSLKVPAGYHLIKGQKLPTSVNIKDKDNAINVYVEKDEAKPAVTTPSKNNNSKATPAPVENAKAPANIANASVKAPSAPVANNTPAPAQQATLPQTGNSRSTAGIVAGSTLLATMATLGIAYKKRKN